MVPREIAFEEKRVYLPALMIHEVFLSTPVATMSEDMESVLQEPLEPIIEHGRAVATPYGRHAKS